MRDEGRRKGSNGKENCRVALWLEVCGICKSHVRASSRALDGSRNSSRKECEDFGCCMGIRELESKVVNHYIHSFIYSQLYSPEARYF